MNNEISSKTGYNIPSAEHLQTVLNGTQQAAIIQQDKPKAQTKKEKLISKLRNGVYLDGKVIKSPERLLEPFLPRVGVACLTGSSDTGKSTILRQLALDVAARNKSFLGFTLNPLHGNVLYICTEDVEEEFIPLFKQQGANIPTEKKAGFEAYFGAEDAILCAQARLEQKDRPLDLIIVDCFSDVFTGDLKDSSKIREYLNRWQDLAQSFATCILFLHHNGKRTESLEISKNNILAGQGFEAKMRVILELKLHLDPDLRHLCILKGNYLSRQEKSESYILKFDPDNKTFINTDQREKLVDITNKTESGERNTKKDRYLIAQELISKGVDRPNIAKALNFKSLQSLSNLLSEGLKFGWGENENTSHESTEKQ